MRDLDLAVGVGLALVDGKPGFDGCGLPHLLRFSLALRDLLLRLDPRAFFGQPRGLGCARHFGARARGLVGDVALLAELGLLLGALDLQRELARLEILLRDRHLIVADDDVAVAPPRLGDGLEQGQAFGVEEVFRIEEGDVGLVELGQRHRFELEPVRLHVGLDRGLHMLDEIGALLLQVQQRHGGGDRAQAVDDISPSTWSRSNSALLVTAPNVCAASAIKSSSGLTRT